MEGGAPTLGTLEDMLRKSPNASISLQRGPFLTEGDLESEGGCSYTGNPEKWMKEGCRNGSSVCEGFHERDIEGGLCTGEPEGYVKQSSEMDVCFLKVPLLGNMDARFFLGAFLLEEIL